ncbi:MAG: TatD family hydrolase [Flavobacteriales bacterium]|nr:TatD family hydrolase [Flavobacteriales bacterium]
MVDTHCHLYVEEFDGDLDEVIDKSGRKGVKEFWLPAVDSSYHLKMNEIKEKYFPKIKLMVGLHPTYVKEETYQKELDLVERELEKNDYIAIGEIGIDLYWDKTTLEIQKKAFVHQIRLAKRKKLPIVIHARESYDEIFEVLEKENSEELKGIFHCFTGTYEQALKIIDFGFLLGIGGVVTFKNGKIDQFLHKIPLEKIVLETDSPYLAPVPFRGKRNSPEYLEFVVGKLSDLYGVSREFIIEVTHNNAQKLI